MRIMMIHHYGGIGGGTISCLDICKMLCEEGNEVYLAIPNACEYVKKECDRYKIKIVNISWEPIKIDYHSASSGMGKAIIKHVFSLRFKKAWEEFIRGISPDLVILNSVVQAPMVKIVKRMRVKCYLFVRETIHGKRKNILNGIIANYLEQADLVFFLTEFDKMSWRLIHKEKCVVLPDIVNPGMFVSDKSYEIVVKEKVVLYLGGINKEKGALDLLESFKSVYQHMTNVSLIILGSVGERFTDEGWLFKLIHYKAVKCVMRCHKIIEELNNKGLDIRCLGETDDVGYWYRMADMVVFPVKQVHQARPAYEAGFFSKPIIVPDYRNFEENVMNGINGVVYKKHDVQDLADKIMILLNDKEKAEQLGKNNYQHYLNCHTYEYAKTILIEAMKVLVEKS